MMLGQGKKLPDFLGCEGEWIVEGHIFLYHESAVRGNSVAKFTFGAQRHDNHPCIGFESNQIAAALGVDVDTVTSANRDGSLIVLGTANVTPTHGGRSAKMYGFQIGDNRGCLTVETDQDEGAA